MRRLDVGFEINVDHAENHPLAVGRNLRIADALQLHHVVEREGMLGLGDTGESKDESKKEEKKTAHERTPWQTEKCSREEWTASRCYITVILRPAHFAGRRACPELVEGIYGLAGSIGAASRLHRSFGGQSTLAS